MNVCGLWREGFGKPLWVMGNLAADELACVYEKRTKIEQTFRDAKSLLEMEKVMSKKREQLEITLALVLVAYALGLMVGEAARDEAYSRTDEKGGSSSGMRRKKWGLYSGLFVLLKKRLRFSGRQWKAIMARVLASWKRRLLPPLPGSVRSHG